MSTNPAYQPSDNFDQAPSSHSNLITLEALAKYRNDAEAMLHLLRAWIDLVKETGEYDYPELVQVSDQAYVVSTNSTGMILMPRTANHLLKQVNDVQQEIADVSLALKEALDDLVEQFSSGRVGDRTALDNSQACFKAFFSVLCQHIESLLGLVQEYGQPTSAKITLTSSSPWGFTKPLQLDAETQRELVHSFSQNLRYMSHYCIEQVQADQFWLDLAHSGYPDFYFRRLLHYLTTLPRISVVLAEILRQNIRHRTAGSTMNPG